MNLDEHVFADNDKQKRNNAIKTLIENNFDDNLDLFEEINNLAFELESKNDTNKKAFEDSLLENILQNKAIKQNQYKTSSNFDFLKSENLVRNGFYTIAGFSSSGKTTFATQLALDLLEHNPNTVLVVYSMDDSVPFLVSKMIKQLFSDTVLSQKLSEIDVNNSEKIFEYGKKLDKNIVSRIHLFDNMSVFNDYSTKSVYNHLKTIQNYHSNIENLNLIVVIDYLQVIEHDYKDNREGLNRVCKELKNIQKSFNCMMFALSQLSNEGNYRETSEIRNISDIIIKQYSEREYLERERRKVEYETSLNFIFSVEKNKSGSKGMFYKAFIGSNFNFYDFQPYKLESKSPKAGRANNKAINDSELDCQNNSGINSDDGFGVSIISNVDTIDPRPAKPL